MKTRGQRIREGWAPPTRWCSSTIRENWTPLPKWSPILKFVVTVCVWVCVFLSLSYPSYSGTPLQIWHDPPMCATPESPIRISAIIEPILPKEARVYFKKPGAMPFYFVSMKQERGTMYTGIIPAPVATTRSVEYVILVVDNNGNIQISPSHVMLISNELGCSKYLNSGQSERIVVYAESPVPPEFGFSGKNVQWNVSNYSGKTYLNNLINTQVQASSTSSTREQERSHPLIDTKTALGLGVGLGAAAATVLLLTGQEEKEKVDWSIAVGERAKNIGVEVTKIPDTQTSCGTLVINQLYVTNKRAESLTISTIDYEVVLTKDDPGGSCEGGQTGTFTPNVATVVQSGETALIREWSNVVNPCGSCPYFIAECQWSSRYIVHTSAGDASGKSKFTVEGDLCGLPAAKSLNSERVIRGDVEP